MFHPISLVPVEGIMTMIRAIKTDHDLDPKCSSFGIHVVLDIRYMTNDINFSCYVGVLGVSMTSIIVFEFFCCYMALWRTHLYFETDDLEIKMGFDHGH